MIRLTKLDAPTCEFEIQQGADVHHIKVFADWLDGSDYANDQLETAVKQFDKARSLSYWLGWFELRLMEKTTDSRVDEICRQLSGNGPAIYRYLASHPRGVTFAEFVEHRDPLTRHRLTESDDPGGIAAMLRRLSGKLSQFGERIEARPTENLIRLSARNNSQV